MIPSFVFQRLAAGLDSCKICSKEQNFLYCRPNVRLRICLTRRICLSYQLNVQNFRSLLRILQCLTSHKVARRRDAQSSNVETVPNARERNAPQQNAEASLRYEHHCRSAAQHLRRINNRDRQEASLTQCNGLRNVHWSGTHLRM